MGQEAEYTPQEPWVLHVDLNIFHPKVERVWNVWVQVKKENEAYSCTLMGSTGFAREHKDCLNGRRWSLVMNPSFFLLKWWTSLCEEDPGRSIWGNVHSGNWKALFWWDYGLWMHHSQKCWILHKNARLNGDIYVDLLVDSLFRTDCFHSMPSDWTFQQDNAR